MTTQQANPQGERYDYHERLYVLVDSSLNTYSTLFMTPHVASQINRNLDEQSSPYQWIESSLA